LRGRITVKVRLLAVAACAAFAVIALAASGMAASPNTTVVER
jgi:hypothetical protein